tara:strand:- start:206 stop:931 length:726 start_codon:yes stop_codon:yes gene_type:complete
MFGVLAISEDSISTQGFVKLGVQELSSAFTQTTPAIKKVASANNQLSTNFTFEADPSGMALGTVQASFSFTQETVQQLLNVSPVNYNSSFTSTINSIKEVAAASDMSASFTQTTPQNFTASAGFEPSFAFTQDLSALKTVSARSTHRAITEQTTPSTVTRFSSGDLSFSFTSTQIGNKMRDANLGTLTFTFSQDTFGDNLYEDWSDLVPSATENWSTTSRGTGTWTPRSSVSNATWVDPVR